MASARKTRTNDSSKPASSVRVIGPSPGKRRPVAVVDIGSNSIRLVVFDGLKRAFLPVFNEKVLCGMGRGLSESGKLHEEGMALALANLERFSRLAEAMGAVRIEMLATAAVRDAENGAAFVTEVERRCGHPVRVLSGEEEARLAAMGVVAAIPGADGVVGDLGGGSLELVGLNAGRIGPSETLPFGPLRLAARDDDRERLIADIDDQLDAIDWLDARPGLTFYAVGGAWRSLARVCMEQIGYPLHVIHGYSQPAEGVMEVAGIVQRLGRRSLARFSGISRRRLETLPLAALVIDRVMRRVRPETVSFCAYGLREGCLFSALEKEERERDPLLELARELARDEGRFGDLGQALYDWSQPLFGEERDRRARLRLVACHLSDLAWRDHPDYRAEQAMLRLLRQPIVAANHAERAFLALSVYTRYGGNPDSEATRVARQLLSEDRRRAAELLGTCLRLGYTLSGGTQAVLSTSRLLLKDGKPDLELAEAAPVPTGDVVERRLNAVRKAYAAWRERRSD